MSPDEINAALNYEVMVKTLEQRFEAGAIVFGYRTNGGEFQPVSRLVCGPEYMPMAKAALRSALEGEGK